MIDTPDYVKEIRLKIWLSKTPEERICQFISVNDIMFKALREFKINYGLPLCSLDPAGQLLLKSKEKE